MNRLDWLQGFEERMEGPAPGTQAARYSLHSLAARGLLKRQDANAMLMHTDLMDFGWRVVWNDAQDTPAEDLIRRIDDVDGYVIFLHGWTGSQAIWEDMPAEIVKQNPRLVSVVLDHNGFGDSPFADRTPEYNECSPAGTMAAVEMWLKIVGLQRPLGDNKVKTINFVGHSMGGAALFFLDEAQYRVAEVTRTALAPALLLYDDQGRAFFQTLGLGIGLVGRLQFLEAIERLVSPRILETLTNGASDAVKEIHRQIYENTPRSVTARTLAAMGTIKDTPMPRSWQFIQVFLGHKDVLVGLMPMMDLLYALDFSPQQVKVTMGTHYFFSVGEDWARVHAINRAMLIEDILKLHQVAWNRQKKG